MPSNFWLFLGSAGVGALVSSIINGIVNYLTKKRELEREDLELCLKLTEMRHQQLVTVQDWAAKGAPVPMELWDPLILIL